MYTMEDNKLHALLSPSSAHRWIKCPASVRFSEGLREKGKIAKDNTSTFAEEGTKAHEVAEAYLRHYILHEVWDGNDDTDDEMQANAKIYLDYVKSIIGNSDDFFLDTERQVSIDTEGHCFGTVDCILKVDNHLHIIDYKYGKGVEVLAVDNPQLLLYAFGVIKTLELEDIDKVSLHIVQPRIANISRADYGIKDLIFWLEDNKVSEQGAKAIAGEKEFKAGSHCKFCPALVLCKEYSEYITRLKGFMNREITTLSLDELRELISSADELGAYITKVKEYIHGKLEAGEAVEGFKLVAGRGRRVINDEASAINRLDEAGFAKEIVSSVKLKTITELEKILGKKGMTTILGELVETKAGSPVLAFSEDKRPAIAGAFNDLKDLAL